MLQFLKKIPAKITHRVFVGIFIAVIHCYIFWCLNVSPYENILRIQQKSSTVSFLDIRLIPTSHPSAVRQLEEDESAAAPTLTPIHPPSPAISVPPPNAPVYLGSREVDKPALPTGEPNIQLLNGSSSKSGLPIRLRVFIDARGNVTKVVRLLAPPADEDLVERIINMMQQTMFMPAKRAGNDVASYRDLEFNISDIN